MAQVVNKQVYNGDNLREIFLFFDGLFFFGQNKMET